MRFSVRDDFPRVNIDFDDVCFEQKVGSLYGGMTG